MSQPTPPDGAILSAVLELLPEAQAVYIFGSRAHGQEWQGSDLDLGVLVPGKAEVLALWYKAQELASRFDMDVDLVDLRAASTVLQHQVVTTGRRLFAAPGLDADRFEIFVLKEMTDFNEARAGVMADIAREGRVYGR